MNTRTTRGRSRSRASTAALAILAAALVASPSSADHAGTATSIYTIDVHRISAAGTALRNHCYRLSGSVGQPAPGWSSGATFSVSAGFWPAVAVDRTDQMFFNSFEGC